MRFFSAVRVPLCWIMAAWLFIAPATASALTITEEEALGKDFARMVAHQYQVIKDPFIDTYINRLGRRLLSAFPPQPFVYHFNVVKEDVYNAFAGPGGNVYFNSGLIIALDYEDELAGIVAHEIAHVDSRHISEQIDRSKKINTAMLAGVVASIFLGGAGAATAASALGVGSMAAGQSATLSYSRQNEIEADKKGLTYMADAGYAKEGMLGALNTIRSKQWFGREQVPTYLMTHPALEDRLVYIGSVLDQEGVTANWHQRPDAEFQIVKARLTALFSDLETGLMQLQGAVTRNPNFPFARYGLGLALMRKGDTAAAINHLAAASTMLPTWPIVRSDLGTAYFLAGFYGEAQNLLRSVLDETPKDYSARLYLGRTLMQTGDLNEAVSELDVVAEEMPQDSDAQFYLGEAYHRLGNAAQAHFHLGAAYFIRRNFSSAAFHLERALAAELPPEQAEDAKKMLENLPGSREKKKKP
ncbi:MAG: M48 family metalloprotease [Pseudomonadota bacterium]